jgi:hypothetical protein
MSAQRLRRVLHFGDARSQLNGGIAILVLGALRHDLAVLQEENSHRYMFAGLIIDPRHPDFSSNYT